MSKLLKENWLSLVLFGAQVIGWAIAGTLAYASLVSHDQAQDKRVEIIEKAVPTQLSYQVQANTTDIAQLKSDQRTTSAVVNQVSAKLDVMASKIDFLVDRQRRTPGVDQ